MPVKDSSNTKILKRFFAAFKPWFQNSGYKQVDFAPLVGLKQGRLNDILHGHPCSIAIMERITNVIGIDILDFLEQGRLILGEGSCPPLPDWLSTILPDLINLPETDAKIVQSVIKSVKDRNIT
jgi:hypothetical protein